MIRALVRVFSSVRTAVVLLLAVAAVVAVATIRGAGIDPASGALRRDWTGSWWFTGLLAALALNVLGGTVKRARFDLPNLGFLINHAGVLLVLLGAFLSFTFKVRGRLSLPEGARAAALEIDDEPELAIEVPDRGLAQTVAVRVSPYEPTELGRKIELSGANLALLRHLPHAEVEERWEEGGPPENPVALLTLHRADGRTARTAVRDGGAAPLEGSAWTVLYRRCSEESYESLRRPAGPQGTLRITLDGETKEIDVRANVGKAVSVGRRTVTIRKFIPHFRAGAPEKSDDGPPLHPAVRFDLSEGGSFLAFAFDPGNTPMKAGGHAKGDFDCVLRFPLQAEAVILVQTPARTRFLRTGPTGETAETEAKEGRRVTLAGPLELELTALLARARRRTLARELVPKDQEARRPALQVSLDGEPEWLPFSRSGAARRELGRIVLEYRPRRHALDFGVALEKFHRPFHPGTREAAQFESTVVLFGPDGAPAARRRVGVNAPMAYGGFVFHQASFDDRADPVVSIFQVSRDPGRPVVYVGFALTVAGMLYMFYLKPVLLKRRTAGVVAGGLMALLWIPGAAAQDSSATESIGRILVQHHGRYKPLDTLAREFLWFFTGDDRGGGDPVGTLLDLLSSRGEGMPLFAVPDPALRATLGLDPGRDRFTPAEIGARAAELDRRAMEAAPHVADPTPLQRSLMELWDRHEQYLRMREGRALRMLPLPSGPNDQWPSLRDLDAWLDGKEPLPPGVAREKLEAVRAAWRSVLKACADRDAPGLARSGAELSAALRRIAPPASDPGTEILYHRLDLFKWSIRGYFAAFGLFVLALVFRSRALWVAAVAAQVAVLAAHGTGLVLRGLVAGRVPFSNMYESMALLAPARAAVAAVLEILSRARVFGLTATLIAGALLAFDRANTAFNPFVSTIPPALQSFWMQVHVPTIITGYACSFLLMGAGVAYLAVDLVAPRRADLRAALDGHLHRALQLTALFFFAGIALGAVWAGEAWGRYWGWDLKEIWALACLVWYLAVAHARIAGRIGGFGTALASLGGTMLVLVNYYGVNFLFGKGLHTYGFGQGSVWTLLLAAGALGALAVAALIARLRRKGLGDSESPGPAGSGSPPENG